MDKSKIQYLHRCKFLSIPDSPIQSIGMNRSGNNLVLIRKNGLIELWNINKNSTTILKEYISSIQNQEPRKIHLFKREILTYGLNGLITKFSISSIGPNHSETSPSYGGAIWSASISKKRKLTACCCEDGSLRIFKFQPKLQLEKSIIVSDKRILSVCWSKNENLIIAGSSNGLITVWDYTKGQNILRITTENPENNKIWDVECDEKTIMSGDSMGNTSFWDITTGVLISSYKAHSADVLSISMSNSVAFSSGVDSKIAIFFKTEKNIWSRNSTFRPQALDILCLKVNPKGNTLYSGGIDGKLGESFVNNNSVLAKPEIAKPRNQKMHLRLLQPLAMLKRKISLNTARNMLAVAEGGSMSIWRLERSIEKIKDCNEEKVVQITNSLPVYCLDFSPSGLLLAFSDFNGTYVAFINDGETSSEVKIEKIKKINDWNASLLRFLDDDNILILHSSDKLIRFRISENNSKTIDFCNALKLKSIKNLGFSLISLSIAISTSNQNQNQNQNQKFAIFFQRTILIYNNKNELIKTMSGFESDIISGEFSTDGQLFFVVSRNELMGFELERFEKLKWFEKYAVRIKRILRSKIKHQIIGLTPHFSNRNLIYLFNRKQVIKIDISKPPPPPPSENYNEYLWEDSLILSDIDDGEIDINNFKSFEGSNSCGFMFLDSDSVVSIEEDSKRKFSMLPKALYRHKFGIGV